MAKVYNQRPSIIIGLVDDYTSFCFDEALAYIISEIEKGNEPKFPQLQKTYKSTKEMYKSLGF